MDYFTFSLILDDIVFPDGRTAMEVLGGGGPQTAFGMKLFADKVGLAAGVGHNFPLSAQAWLDATGIDTRAIQHFPEYETLRAWQVMDWDGRRTQVWRTQGKAIPTQLALDFERLPPDYQRARGFHMGIHPESPDLSLLRALYDNGVIVSVEPFRHADRLLRDGEIRALMEVCHIFSPNLYEAQSILGPAAPEQQIQRMLDAGAAVVVMRMGADGSLMRRAGRDETVHVPAVQTHIVDTVGAGNAFCGAFLVGWVETDDLQTAGEYGAVAASFLVEQVGLPRPDMHHRHAAQERLSLLRTA